MVADADVGMTVKKVSSVNDVTQGNAQINIDKMRYNQDEIIVPIYYNRQNLRMHELGVVM